MKISTLVLLAALVFSAPLASKEQAPAMQVSYGQVNAIEVTTKKSAVARNALIGSLVGLAIDESVSGAVLGASTGFIVTSIIEADRRVFLYTLEMTDGDRQSIAVERPDLAIGHCAAIEQKGKHSNLRPVSAVHCVEGGVPGSSKDDLDNHRLQIAEKCHDARSQLAKGGSSEEIETALRNLRSYCD